MKNYHVMWHTALKNAVGENRANILEIASGADDIIPQVMDTIFSRESEYILFNMNKQLTQELYRKTNGLAVSVLVMEEDPRLIPDYFGPGYFNAVVFRNSVNCIIQEILEHKEEKEFLRLLSDCMDTLEEGGMIIFSNLMFYHDLYCGYPYEVCQDMLLMIRKWILESDLKLQEIEPEGFDKQWWMFLRKKPIACEGETK